jgi:hypothetical protein
MKIKFNHDKILTFAAFFPIVLLTLQIIIVGLKILPHSGVRIISIVISGLFMLPALIIIVKRKLKLLLISYAVVYVLIAYSYLFFPENAKYIFDEMFNLLLIIVPAFLCIASVSNLQNFKSVLNGISNVIFLLGFLYFILVFLQRISFANYNMSYSYYLLLPALVFSSQKKISSNLKVIIILFLMLVFGSRGPLFIAVFYFIISNTIYFKKKILLYLTILISVLLILLIDFNAVLVFTEKYIGFSPRTLYFIINEQTFSDTNRFGIFKNVWESILDGPFLGRGLFSDRVINNGTYSHNLLLEVLHGFGFFLGSVLIVYLLWITVYTYKRTNKNERNYFLIFFFYGFLPLLFTGSYIQHNWFAVFLGGIILFFNLNKNKNIVGYNSINDIT